MSGNLIALTILGEMAGCLIACAALSRRPPK